VELVDRVKEFGGNVFLFSAGHISGEKLNDLSGIAAILRFPLNMDYLDEKEDVVDDDEETKSEVEDISEFINNDELDKEFFETLNQAKENKYIPDKEKDKEISKEKHLAEKSSKQ